MADINIERKRPSIWLWVVSFLALVVVVYFAARLIGDRADDRSPATQTTQ